MEENVAQPSKEGLDTTEGYCALDVAAQKYGFLHDSVENTNSERVEETEIGPPSPQEDMPPAKKSCLGLVNVNTSEEEKEIGRVGSDGDGGGVDSARPQPLRVLQWNVLADGLAQFGSFYRVEKGALEWNARAPLLLGKMLEYKPHIICLQELNHFDDWLLPELQKHSYDGVFWKKPWSATNKYKYPTDGCAIFYQTSRVQLLEKNPIQYVDSRGAKQSQGGLVCRFKDVEVDEGFVLATTHLKAKGGTQNEQMRILQAQQLLQRLKTMSGDSSTPIIICGDFNADPFSDVYNVLHAHVQSVYSLTCRCDPPHEVEESEVLEICNVAVDGGAHAEPPFTTWKFRPDEGEKRRTIDYIWYKAESKLLPHRRWPIPSQATIGVNALPSANFPSDHLPLMCDFEWSASLH